MTHFVRGHHGLFVPTYRDIITPEVALGFSGHIHAELIDAKTHRVKRQWHFRNLITNGGLNGMNNTAVTATSTILAKYCGVGTGSTAPANTDTTLVAEIAGRVQYVASPGPITSYVAGSPDYHKVVADYLFTEAQANGNLTEIGFFSASSAGTMFSRQLFKDDLGTPTTVVKTSSDQLKVTYEIRLYPPAASTLYSAQDISGTSVDVTLTPMGVGTSSWNVVFGSSMSTIHSTNVYCRNGTLPSRTSTIVPGAISGGTPGTVSTAAYVTDNFYLDRTHVYDTTNGTGTITCVAANTSPTFAVGFSPGLAKDNTKRFTLNTRISWGRHA